MTDYSKAVFLPANKRALNLYKGYILKGELLTVSESDIYTTEILYTEDDSKSKLELIVRIISMVFLIPLLLIILILVLPVAAIFKKSEQVLKEILASIERVFRFLFRKKRTPRHIQSVKEIYEGIVHEDVPAFIDHCKSNSVKVYLYTYHLLNDEEQLKVNQLVESGVIFSFHVITKLSDLQSVLLSDNISIRNSLLVITDPSEKSEAALLGFNLGGVPERNVELLKEKDANADGELEWNRHQTIIELKSKIEYYMKARGNAFLPINLVLFVEGEEDDFLNNYILRNIQKINERLKGKGAQLIYFPSLQMESRSPITTLDFLRYRLPLLYALTDLELREAIFIMLKRISATEFYGMVIEQLELPYFKKPALLRNISTSPIESKFTYKSIEYKTQKDLDEFFDWYINQFEIPTGNENTYFSLVKPPEDYDADWFFGKEAKEESEELKQKIDKYRQEGKYGALVEAIMYMLETIKEEKPEIIDKVRPLLEKRKLLESKVVLSNVVIDKHCNIFLPGYGNMEVKMHALPKTVYLLFLRYPNGIRFKELYQYKAELLEIYNKVTNKYEKDEIERAIDDLVDMTKPSINQKCARIREAFRNIMDEHVAKYYYIDGINGEPKSIALPKELIEIQARKS